MIKFEETDFNNTLTDKKSHKNILTYDISYKILTGPKPSCIRFNKIEGFFRIYDGNIYLVLFVSGKYDVMYYRYLIWISYKS